MKHLLLNDFTTWYCQIILNFLNLAKLVKNEAVLAILFVHTVNLGFLYDSLTNFVTIANLKGITMCSDHLFEKSCLYF